MSETTAVVAELVKNGMKEIKDFFGTPERPVTGPEMMAFWKSLTDEEKEYYKTADLGR